MQQSNTLPVDQKQLLTQLQNYDSRAWEYIWEIAYQAAFSKLSRSTYVREPHEDAKDLAQDTMLKLIDRLQERNDSPIRNVAGLEYITARNNSYNEIRRRQIRIEMSTSDNVESRNEIDLVDARLFLEAAIKNWIHKEEPSSQLRAIVELTLQGIEVKEISNFLGIKSWCVYSTKNDFFQHVRNFSEGFRL